MAIVAGDIELRLSGGASNTDPDAALGGAMSTVGGGLITDASDNNLFDDVSGDDADAGDTEYRCFYVKNNHGTLTWQSVVVWIQTETAGGDSVDIALAGEGLNGTAETVADEDTAPIGESFSHVTTKGTGLSIGNMAAGDYHAIWVKRIVPGSTSAQDANSFTLRFEGDTAA
jgi:hypothetical protein